jgi:cytochrome c2
MKRLLHTAALLTTWLLLVVACSQGGSPAPQTAPESPPETAAEPTPEAAPDSPAEPLPDPASVGDPQAGEALFTGQTMAEAEGYVPCTTCHHSDPAMGVLIGPNMAGIANRAPGRVPDLSAIEYLRESIVDHDAHMVEGFNSGMVDSVVGQDFSELLTEEETNNLIAYLLTLTDESASSAPASSAAGLAVLPDERGTMVEPDAGGYVSSQDGYALQPVPGWQTHAISEVLVLWPPDVAIENGPFIAARFAELDSLNIPNVDVTELITPELLFTEVFTSFQEESFAITLHDSTRIELDGVPVQVANFQGSGFGDLDDQVRGRLAVALVDTTHVFVLLGVARPAAQWDATTEFDAMLQTITFGGSAHTPRLPLAVPVHYSPAGQPAAYHQDAHASFAPQAQRSEEQQREGPRFACVSCHETHDVPMRHDSNPSCGSCHAGTVYQRHCVDCHSIHAIDITHEPNNPDCASCHAQGIPAPGYDVQEVLVIYMRYLFHDI